MGSRTSPFCLGPTEALRTRDGQLLLEELERYVAAAAPELVRDVRDVLVGLAPYVDCARRLGIEPIELFDRASGSVGGAMRETMRTFARRTDVTLEAFGWHLVELPEGPCYRPAVP